MGSSCRRNEDGVEEGERWKGENARKKERERYQPSPAAVAAANVNAFSLVASRANGGISASSFSRSPIYLYINVCPYVCTGGYSACCAVSLSLSFPLSAVATCLPFC